jgi:F-type H+-transporting ATPase subunit delta
VRDETVARNYAETLVALAERHEGIDRYGEGIGTVAQLLEGSPEFRLFLETPRIGSASKKQVLRNVFADELPGPLLNFLLVTVDKRRQRLLPAIAREYRKLWDERAGRAHVDVTVARPLDDATLDGLSRRLSDLLGVTAIPHVKISPEILAGVVVRVGDTIYDGSLRRRLESIRQRLLKTELPRIAPTGAASD